jgi:hypothetical protein
MIFLHASTRGQIKEVWRETIQARRARGRPCASIDAGPIRCRSHDAKADGSNLQFKTRTNGEVSSCLKRFPSLCEMIAEWNASRQPGPLPHLSAITCSIAIWIGSGWTIHSEEFLPHFYNP